MKTVESSSDPQTAAVVTVLPFKGSERRCWGCGKQRFLLLLNLCDELLYYGDTRTCAAFKAKNRAMSAFSKLEIVYNKKDSNYYLRSFIVPPELIGPLEDWISKDLSKPQRLKLEKEASETGFKYMLHEKSGTKLFPPDWYLPA
jgi:hypothetical protein